MKGYFKISYSLFLLFMISCNQHKTTSLFIFEESEQNIKLFEGNKPVFYYQKTRKGIDGECFYNNYIHPLFSLSGVSLTDEFPSDHPYHRGVFWAWHQMFINGESIGDGWVMENIAQDVVRVQTETNTQSARLQLKVLWKSSLYEDEKPFIEENTTIIVHKSQDTIRKIDFKIDLQALVRGVEIGGSDDEKGYGGLCVRLKLPSDLTFTSENNTVSPQVAQIKAGPWMDFSASFDIEEEKTGITIFCHPQTPNYPAPWIIRSQTSMQNIVFPGRDKIEIPMEKPVTLYYRLVVHNGDANRIDLNMLQTEYEASLM